MLKRKYIAELALLGTADAHAGNAEKEQTLKFDLVKTSMSSTQLTNKPLGMAACNNAAIALTAIVMIALTDIVSGGNML